MTTISRWNDIAPGGRRPTRLVLAVTAGLLLLATVPVGLRALQNGSSGTSSSPASAGSGASAGVGAGSSSRTDSGSAVASAAGAAGSASATQAPIVTPKLARSAWLGLEVGNLNTSSAKARAVAAEAGGAVTYENVVTGTGPTGNAGGAPAPAASKGRSGAANEDLAPVGVDEARLTLSVPAPRLDGVLAELARLGTVAYRSSQTQDVTDTYVDAQARIAPAKASVARVQALLADATDLKQVVLIESELSKRQADLDSLTGRLAQLDRQTTKSDVTLTLWTAATAPAASGNGFVDNLKKAWEGMLGSVVVIVAGLAALLPWLVVLGLLAWVGMRLARRRSTGVVPAVTLTSDPPPAGSAPPTE